MNKEPIFICGLRKSGTSFVKRLFDGHPDLFVCPANELHVFKFTADHDARCLQEKKALCNSAEEILDKVLREYFFTRLADPEVNDYIKDFNYETFTKGAQAYLNGSAQLQDVFGAVQYGLAKALLPNDVNSVMNKRFVFKSVLSEGFVPHFLSMFPRGKVLYVLRNPLGHFNSYKNNLAKRVKRSDFKGGRTKEHYFFTDYGRIGSWLLRMWHSYVYAEEFSQKFPANFKTICYDHLLKNSEQEMETVCNFLNIRFDECLLRPSVLGEYMEGNSWYYESLSSFDKRPAEKWKEELEDWEKEMIYNLFPKTVNHYEFDVDDFKKPSFFQRMGNESLSSYILNRLYLLRFYSLGFPSTARDPLHPRHFLQRIKTTKSFHIRT